MGTTESRKQKVEWIKKNRNKYQENELVRQFMLIFNSTKATAVELLFLFKRSKNKPL